MADALYDPDAHVLAIAQARALAKYGGRYEGEESAPEFADDLAYLTVSGLAIELYFKALMLAGRKGRVTKTHDLRALASRFPAFLRTYLEHRYAERASKGFGSIRVVALIKSSSPPSRPTSQRVPGSYETFTDAIESIANVFVFARYFFEEPGAGEYSYFDVPTEPIRALIETLDEAYERFMAGGFAGCAT